MTRKYIRKGVSKKYSDSDFKLAMEAVMTGSSIREASDKFHVPYTTLHSHVNENVLYKHSGRPPIFSVEEELCLEQSALILQVRIGFISLAWFACSRFHFSVGASHYPSTSFLIWRKNMLCRLTKVRFFRPKDQLTSGCDRFCNATRISHWKNLVRWKRNVRVSHQNKSTIGSPCWRKFSKTMIWKIGPRRSSIAMKAVSIDDLVARCIHHVSISIQACLTPSAIRKWWFTDKQPMHTESKVVLVGNPTRALCFLLLPLDFYYRRS